MKLFGLKRKKKQDAVVVAEIVMQRQWHRRKQPRKMEIVSKC